jgi:hypothetical protein
MIYSNVSRPRVCGCGEGDDTCRMLETTHVQFISGYLNFKFLSCEATRRPIQAVRKTVVSTAEAKPQNSFVEASVVGSGANKKPGDLEAAWSGLSHFLRG